MRTTVAPVRLERDDGVSLEYQTGWLDNGTLQVLESRLSALRSTELVSQDCSGDVLTVRRNGAVRTHVIECLPHKAADVIPEVTRMVLGAVISDVKDLPENWQVTAW